MAKTVLYHRPDGLSDLTLVVLKENPDATLELGNEAGELRVGKCPVASVPTVGHCTIPDAPRIVLEGENSGDLSAKTKAELVEVITALNADEKRPENEKIVLTGKETKAELLQLIAKAPPIKPAE